MVPPVHAGYFAVGGGANQFSALCVCEGVVPAFWFCGEQLGHRFLRLPRQAPRAVGSRWKTDVILALEESQIQNDRAPEIQANVSTCLTIVVAMPCSGICNLKVVS